MAQHSQFKFTAIANSTTLPDVSWLSMQDKPITGNIYVARSTSQRKHVYRSQRIKVVSMAPLFLSCFNSDSQLNHLTGCKLAEYAGIANDL